MDNLKMAQCVVYRHMETIMDMFSNFVQVMKNDTVSLPVKLALFGVVNETVLKMSTVADKALRNVLTEFMENELGLNLSENDEMNVDDLRKVVMF